MSHTPDVELRIPADSAFLAVLRTATAGLAARLDFTLDDIEDLRIAVDEACAMVLPQAREGSDLTCAFDPRQQQPHGRRVRRVRPPRQPSRDGFAWTVLAALTSSVQRRGRRRPADRHPVPGHGRAGVTSSDETRAAASDLAEMRARSVALFSRLATDLSRGGAGLGARPARAAAPAARRALRAPVPQPRRAVRRPAPGRHHRPDQGHRPLRPRARRGVLDVRHADDRRRDQAALPRPGLGDPGAAPAPGAAHHDHRRRPPS